MAEGQKKSRSRNWIKEDVERLVCWMGENQEKLRGKQSSWHKDVKEQVFKENEEISVKRIREKAQNMKIAWSKARKLRDQSGAGVRAADYAPTFNAILESKCQLFWRLDEIWGTRLNATPILVVDSTRDPTAAPQEIPAPVQEPAPTAELAPAAEQSGDEGLDWEPTPPPRARVTTSTPTPSSSSRPPKRHAQGDLQMVLGDRAAIELQKQEKRIRLEREMHKERLAAEERRYERQLESEEKIARIHAETQLKQAAIQAEAQSKQIQAFMQMISMIARPPQSRQTPELP